MVISEDKDINAFSAITFLIIAVLAAIFCIWKLTPYRKKNKKTRFRKPKRRTQRSSYNKIHQESPDEEAAGMEKESLDQQEITSRNIIANVLHRIGKRNVKSDTQPENLSEGDIMTRKSKKTDESTKKTNSKNNREENKEDNQSKGKKGSKKNKSEIPRESKNGDGKSYQNEKTAMNIVKGLFSCRSGDNCDEKSEIVSCDTNCSSNGADIEDSNAGLMTTTTDGAKNDVPPLNMDNGISDSADRNNLNGMARKKEKQSPFSRSISLRGRGEKTHDPPNARVKLQNSKSTEVLGNLRTESGKETPLRRSVSQQNPVSYKSKSEKDTRKRANSSHLNTQGKTRNEAIKHLEGSCQQKMQLAGHDVSFITYGESLGQQYKHVQDSPDVILHNISSVDAPGDCAPAEYASSGTGQKRVDSRKCHTTAVAVDRHKSQKAGKNYVDEHGSDEKIDCVMSGHYYENHRIEPMELYSEEKAPKVFDLPDENAQQECKDVVVTHVENHSVSDSYPIGEYSTRLWRGETHMSERSRKKMQDTVHDLQFSDCRGDINHQRKHAENNSDVFLHSYSPFDVPGSLAPAKHTTNSTVPKRVEFHIGTEATGGYKLQKENENCVNENMSDIKIDSVLSSQYYENYRINPYSKKKAPEVDLPDEYAQQKYTNMVQTCLENYSVSDPFPIDEYAAKEWRGETLMAETIRKGYSRVKEETGLICLRQIRGDNYCALRAVLFKALSSGISILAGFQMNMRTDDILDHLSEQYSWITNWSFANRLTLLNSSFVDTMNSCLSYLSWIANKSTKCFDDSQRYRMVLDIMNKEEENEVRIFEAIKFLMLYSSIQLYNKIQNQDFTLLGSLLFARDTSPDPEAFMKNHLNCVGDTAGIDQLEMMLLGQTLNVVIKVFRLHRVDKEDFIVQFPDDLEYPEGIIELIAEDDRHYNVTSEEA